MDDSNELETRSFLGTGWAFPPTFSRTTKAVQMVSYEQDIEQSLRILFSTEIGERVMLPEYGSELRPMLFDTIDTSKLYYIKELVRVAVLNFEPRIDLLDVMVDGKDYLDGIIHISLDYRVRRTNNRANMVYPYYFIEGTNLPGKYRGGS